MNLKNRMIQGVGVIILVVALIVTVTSIEQPKTTTDAEGTLLQPGTAGIINAIQFDKEGSSSADLEIFDSQDVTAPEAGEEEDEDVVVDHFFESAVNPIDPEWVNRLMVTVEDASLNVRAEASTESEILGKMFAGSGATILEYAGEWVKIQSGNVTGYVHSDYCAFGNEAKALAEKSGKCLAKATTDNLRVRSLPSVDGSILTTLEKGKTLPVATDAETVEGWVAVTYKNEVAYISADYVEVSFVVDTAMTLAEYKAKVEAETKLTKDEQRAKNRAEGRALAEKMDILTVMAAIIYCEAGDQCYEGMVAVGAVIMNRVESSAYPDDILSVIFQKGQFSPAGSGWLTRRLKNAAGIPQVCFDAAQDALDGVDPVNGLMHFNMYYTGKPFVMQIGDHIFW